MLPPLEGMAGIAAAPSETQKSVTADLTTKGVHEEHASEALDQRDATRSEHNVRSALCTPKGLCDRAASVDDSLCRLLYRTRPGDGARTFSPSGPRETLFDR